jgi:hypothetical protein
VSFPKVASRLRFSTSGDASEVFARIIDVHVGGNRNIGTEAVAVITGEDRVTGARTERSCRLSNFCDLDAGSE